MNTTHRLAVGAVALAAALTPAAAFASTHAPAPASSHSAGTAPSATPPPPGTKISRAALAYDHDENLLQAQVSLSAWEAGVPAWVRCMNRAGLPTVATSTGPTAGGWTFATPTTPRARFLESAAGENASTWIQADCMVAVYHLHG